MPTDPPIVGNDESGEETVSPETGSPPPVTTTSATEPTTTETESGTGTSESGESTMPLPPPVCGNGFVEGDEPCDDGNEEPEDGCNALCERTGVPIWTQSWDSGAMQDDIATGIAVGADGNLYVSGTVEGADMFSDAVVRKLSPDGTELLQFVYAGQFGFDDGSAAVAVGEDGRVYFGGYEGLTADGPEQAFVSKFTDLGEVEWTYNRPAAFPEGSSTISGVAVRGDAIFVAGSEEVADDEFEVFIHRLDPSNGMPLWTVSLADSAGFNVHGLAIEPGGDVVIATALLLGQGEEPVPVLARLAAADGAEVWQQTYGGGDIGFARGLAINGDGDIAVSGSLRSNGGHLDIWTARLDADGATVWEEVYDRDSADDRGLAVGWSSSGEVYAAGFVFEDGQQSNAWVRRYTGDGAAYWTSLYNDPSDLYDEVQGIAVTDAQVVVAGNENVLMNGINQWIRAYEP